jgi:hypothetical protein
VSRLSRLRATRTNYRIVSAMTDAIKRLAHAIGLASLVPYADINELFTTDYRARQADGLRSAGSA